MAHLDQALAQHEDAPDADELTQLLAEFGNALGLKGSANLSELTRSRPWLQTVEQHYDSLVATMLDPATAPGADASRRESADLARRLLVAGLVESAAASSADRLDPVALLRDRVIALPSPPFPMTEGGDAHPVVMRGPAFADLYVVRSEWNCFAAGEIAHIDNVLQGELKERVHARTEEVETVVVTETETTTSQERDTQSTERFSLESQVATESRLAVSLEARMDASGQYGPTRVDTHIGGSVQYSLDEARKMATQQAREVVTRAVSKVEQRVREERTTRRLTRIEERNTHRFDATDADHHVIGIYRWVDKIQRLQLFRYRHRYILEFQIPEPASYVRWLLQRPARGVDPPTHFTVDGTEGATPLTIAHVTPGTYAALAGRYGVTDLPTPPNTSVAVAASLAVEPERPDYGAAKRTRPELQSPPEVTKTDEIAIPAGYAARRVKASVAATPALADWGDRESGGAEFAWKVGYHYPRVDVVVAGKRMIFEDPARPTVQTAERPYRQAWLTAQSWPPPVAQPPVAQPPGGPVVAVPARPAGWPDELDLPGVTGTMDVAVTCGGSYRVSVSLAVVCEPEAATLEKWRIETYSRIRNAYLAAQQQFEAQSQWRAGPVDTLREASPEANADRVEHELKRQVIEFLFGAPFVGFRTIEQPSDGRPRVDISAAAAAAPFVQFFEQAFEWHNLAYVMYPYFWADGTGSRWEELNEIEATDPDFHRFLRAGSAHVVVPARPGFEAAVNAYLNFGVLWSGGAPPAPDDPLYLSIADEIRAMNQAPDDGEQGESWEVRLPTTLVWLDPDSTLPKRNEHPRLSAPADPLCA